MNVLLCPSSVQGIIEKHYFYFLDAREKLKRKQTSPTTRLSEFYPLELIAKEHTAQFDSSEFMVMEKDVDLATTRYASFLIISCFRTTK